MKSCLKEVICKTTLLLVHLIFFFCKKPKTCQIKEFINILTIGVATRKNYNRARYLLHLCTCSKPLSWLNTCHMILL